MSEPRAIITQFGEKLLKPSTFGETTPLEALEGKDVVSEDEVVD